MNAILSILPAAAWMAFASAAPLGLPQEPGYTGSAYWSQFPATRGKWDRPEFFPIGVWFEGVYSRADTDADKAAGINTYVALTAPSDLSLVRAAGMYAIRQFEVTDETPTGLPRNYGEETVGWLVGDEYDMKFGAGSAEWDGIEYDQKDGNRHCIPKTAECGHTVAKTMREKFPRDGRFYFQNYAKTVAVWGANEKVAPFINAGWQDTVGIDLYWYADTDACIPSQGGRYVQEGLMVGSGPLGWGVGSPPALLPEECHRASNYGANIKRLRQLDALDGKYQPLWCFPEVTARPEQIQGAAMSCLIQGAQGMLYFNHNFGTPCTTHHALREPCYAKQRAAVTEMNALIRELAPVLNSPRLKWNFGAEALDTRLSQAPDGTAYVFAQQNRKQSGSFSLTLPPALAAAASAKAICSGTPFVRRNVSIAGGRLPVDFAKESDWCVFAIGADAKL